MSNLQSPIFIGVHPLVVYSVKEMLIRSSAMGMNFEAQDGKRNPFRQHELFMLGRKLENGVWVPVDPVHRAGIVTNADSWDSWHAYGLAIDCVRDGSPKPGYQPSWEAFADDNKDGINDWQTLGALGMEQGLTWGGSLNQVTGKPIFGILDVPHFQRTNNLLLSIAKDMVKKDGLPRVWKFIDTGI